MSDPRDWLDGLDAPLPLSAELRERLQSRFAAGEQSRPLDAEFASRLSNRLTDPVADLLHDLDAPRALSPGLRGALLAGLASAPRRRWLVPATAASIAAAVIVALAVGTSPGDRKQQPVAGASPGARASATPTPGLTGGVAGGLVPAPGRPVPVTAPGQAAEPPPPSAAPAPVAGQQPSGRGDSYGYYEPGRYPAAMRPDGGSPGPAEPTPEVTSRTPDAGPLGGGTDVRISGSRLRSATSVTFGDAVGTGFRVLDDKHLAVTSPAHDAGVVSFVVHFADGGTFTVRDGFTYLRVPHIEDMSPDTGPAAGGTWVVVRGSALTRVSTVSFGSSSTTKVDVVSDTQLRVLTPAHALGPAEVTARSPGGTSNAARFVYLP